MNGADRLCDALLAGGVNVCFANPGTSEMAFVAALDRRPDMRCVLGLFEGVATGAADGYARMTDQPAAVLLHTGPGLANGLANLHNARRAFVPVVNVVGDHASYHLPFDAPLTSDIESLARPMSSFVRRVTGPDDVAEAAVAAHAAALSTRGVATLILPANAAWSETTPGPTPAPQAVIRPPVPADRVTAAAALLRKAGSRAGLFLAGQTARQAPLDLAARIAAKTGARLFGEVLCGRIERGQGVAPIERIPYPIDLAVELLKDIDVLVLVGGREPVAFFAYPGKPSRLVGDQCDVMSLASPVEDAHTALMMLADELAAPAAAPALPRPAPEKVAPSGPLTNAAMAAMLAGIVPEGAIIAEEALTSIPSFYAETAHAPRHDYLMVTGGAIGVGIPLATGAAVACPDRKVINLQADGSGMYTLQGLWTQARERLDVLTVVFSNRAYAILRIEMQRMGIEHPGRNARRMMDIDDPALDWVALARGMGVEGGRAETCEDFARLLEIGLARRGPFLIEAVM
jgi:acetolactate synthase-1/2/3 large subunit